ncbi:MAG: DegT/DnrJ/EryC1/StrS aminotransferase family protein, partial [Actinomycetes bacterium]
MTVVEQRQPTKAREVTNNIPFVRTKLSPEALTAATRVLESGWLTTGPEVQLFEAEFAAWVGADYAVATSSCTAAIELGLRALRLPRGSRVLVSTITFCGAVHAIIHAGYQPVLVDVDPVTVMPSVRTVRDAVDRPGHIDAMLVVHLAGAPANVDELADAAGLDRDRIVEDAAHALGTRCGTKRVGSGESTTCFSFYATKNLPIGEGGMVTTNNADVAERIRRMRLHGMSTDAWRRYLPGGSWRYTVETSGLKANMTDVQASIGRAQLRHLADWQRRRREIAARYDRSLAGVPGIALPQRPRDGGHAWHLYAVRVLPLCPDDHSGIRRDRIADELARRGIGTSVHFIPLHTMPFFMRSTLPPDPSFVGAEAAYAQLLSLPMHPNLTDEEVDVVSETLGALLVQN